MIKLPSRLMSPANANKLYMALTTLCRALVGFSVYLILTRMLAPAEYGLMMTALSAATLAALITDFGFGWKALRDIGADPENGRGVFIEAIRFKLGMTVLVAAIGTLVIWTLPLAHGYKLPAALFALGVLVNGIGDLGVVGFRAIGRFKTETLVVLVTSLLYAAAILAAALLLPDNLTAIAIAFLVGRAIYAAAAVLGPLLVLTSAGKDRERRAISATARDGLPWAVDNALIVLLLQLDTMLLAHFGRLADVGIYQAGGRLLDNLFALSNVLASVHIPILARSRSMHQREYAGERRKIVLEFAGVGLLVALGIMLIGPVFTKVYLKSEYAPLLDLWPGLGVLLFLRFVVGGLGAILTAAGFVRQRIVGEVIGVAVTFAAFAAIYPVVGLQAMPWIMSIGVVAVAGCYALFLMLDNADLRKAAS